ncbi:hypothetical protein MA16_Dca009797 [Dendrobium catenatum]|uniref:DUF674 domain-containing protein n=1 Tax=Dendrobium catenatum TaxID=906689 RepID=A0A2I0XI94_9ASPA|nr:hypothetical protein MA16_Dca009797 [Dendrobium catenatum]
MAVVNSKITLKLLIDARSHKILFGEAGKDFVDFLFSLLTLPLGSIIKLLSPSTMMGSIGKLYQSVENLNEIYLVANIAKASLLQPKVSSYVANHLLLGTNTTVELKYYLCSNCKRKVTTVRNTVCPNCSYSMVTEVAFVVPSGSASSVCSGNAGESVGGFVKEVVTYMITDDLEVTPMSAISSITLINRFIMKKDVQLQEKVVAIGMKEVTS